MGAPAEGTTTLDSTGQSNSWIDVDGDHPVITHPNAMLFHMQFPYGPKIEEESGNGTTVRLTIKTTADQQGTHR